jgi:hypothetical protein
MSRPRKFIGVAFVVATRESDWAGSTRTMAPPSLLAAMAMLPRMTKASPPNISFSEFGIAADELPDTSASSWS